MNPEWKALTRFPAYEASSAGLIRRREADRYGRHKGLVIKTQPNHDGYLLIKLIDMDGVRQTVLVSRVIAEAFHGPPPSPSHEAAHNSGVRTDNCESNLRWATRPENAADRVKHGTLPVGEKNAHAKLCDASVRRVRELRAAGRTYVSIARDFGVSDTVVRQIVNRTKWSHVQ